MKKGAKKKVFAGSSSGKQEYFTRRLLHKVKQYPETLLSRNRSRFVKVDKNTFIEDGGLRKKGFIKKDIRGKPLISVITTVFNGVNSIERTIKSIIHQSYDNLEYIIVDAGSTDGTLDVIRKYDDAINYWISGKDRGIYDGMNRGLDLARGEWVNFMNACDEFASPDVIEYIAGIIRVMKGSFIYSDTILFNRDAGRERIHPCIVDKNRRRLVHQSCIYKKELHGIHGNYLVADGVTISDYIFFNQIPTMEFYKSERIISRFDKGGNTSSGRRHFEQKLGTDLVFGNTRCKKAILSVFIYKFEVFKRALRDFIKKVNFI